MSAATFIIAAVVLMGLAIAGITGAVHDERMRQRAIRQHPMWGTARRRP